MDDRRRVLIQGLNHTRNKALSFGTFLFAFEKKSTFKNKITNSPAGLFFNGKCNSKNQAQKIWRSANCRFERRNLFRRQGRGARVRVP